MTVGPAAGWALGQVRSWPARASRRLWNHPFVTMVAAAIAYRTLFSLAPLLRLAIAALGRFVGARRRRAGRSCWRCATGLGVSLDGPILDAVDALLAGIARPDASLRAALLAGAVVVVGASGVFDEIRQALNRMWAVPHRGGRHGLVRNLAARLAGLAMVLLCGVLVVLSLATALRVEALALRLGATPVAAAFAGPGHQAAVFVGLFAAFASVYRVFSDTRLRWSAVWGGALIATVLFTAVRAAFAAYVGWASVGSAYGAAGTVIVAVLWVYVSAWVMLLGAAWVGGGRRRRE
ncbi:MAG: YihY/virulence factor BrkB family protein [Anaerolineae bacterium]